MDSESSDEEWVFGSSSSEDPTKQKSTVPIRKFANLTISEASKRTIRANIPKSSRLPPMENHTITPQLSPSPPLVLKEEEPSLQFISDEELSHICTDMNAKLLVFRVLQVYKSTEVFLQIRDIETDALSIESRLLSHLHLAAHPTEFIIVSILIINVINY
jgi:hypothetical protein